MIALLKGRKGILENKLFLPKQKQTNKQKYCGDTKQIKQQAISAGDAGATRKTLLGETKEDQNPTGVKE